MEVFIGLVQRQPVRDVHDRRTASSGPYALATGALILCNVLVAAAALVPAGPRHRRRRCSSSRIVRQRRHVAGALRHHRRSACTATSCRRRGACTTPTIWDWATFLGTIGLFLALLFLFIRFLPMISIFEMRDAGARRRERARTPTEATAHERASRQQPRALRPAGRVRHAAGRSIAARRGAARRATASMDAYSPFPIEELAEALGLPPLAAAADRARSAASSAALGGYRPAVLDVGRSTTRSTSAAGRSTAGRRSSRSTFEMTILVAALSAVFGMLGAERPAAAVPPGLQRAALRRWRRATASSSASRRPTRSSTATATRAVPASAWRRRRSESRSERVTSRLGASRSGARAAVARSLALACCRLPAGHARPAERTSRYEASDVLRRRQGRAAARRPARVARGDLREDAGLYTGDDADGRARRRRCPCRSTRELLLRGQRALRHLLLALPRPARRRHGAWSCSAASSSRRRSTTTRLRDAPVGYFFDVITNGFGVMPSYAAQVPPEDRWAIAAYIRALQLSQHAPARRPARRRPRAVEQAAQRRREPPPATGAGRATRHDDSATAARATLRAAGRARPAPAPRPDRRRRRRSSLCGVGFVVDRDAVLPRLPGRLAVLARRRARLPRRS